MFFPSVPLQILYANIIEHFEHFEVPSAFDTWYLGFPRRIGSRGIADAVGPQAVGDCIEARLDRSEDTESIHTAPGAMCKTSAMIAKRLNVLWTQDS